MITSTGYNIGNYIFDRKKTYKRERFEKRNRNRNALLKSLMFGRCSVSKMALDCHKVVVVQEFLCCTKGALILKLWNDFLDANKKESLIPAFDESEKSFMRFCIQLMRTL